MHETEALSWGRVPYLCVLFSQHFGTITNTVVGFNTQQMFKIDSIQTIY